VLGEVKWAPSDRPRHRYGLLFKILITSEALTGQHGGRFASPSTS
jgi:hypothetical protein